MCPDLEQLGKLIPKEAIGKLYDDMLSGLAKEVGKPGTDIVKVARLLLAPLQVAAAFQDRFETMVKTIGERVPEDRRLRGPCRGRRISSRKHAIPRREQCALDHVRRGFDQVG